MLLRTAFPLPISLLKEKFSVCSIENPHQWHMTYGKSAIESVINSSGNKSLKINFENSSAILFYCDTLIPVSILSKANTMNLLIKSNQKIDLKMIAERNQYGGYAIESKIDPEENDGFTLVSGRLGNKNAPKINWLTGDYNQVFFSIDSPNKGNQLILEIENIYLE